MRKPKKNYTKNPPGSEFDELAGRCTLQELEAIYEALLEFFSNNHPSEKETSFIIETVGYCTPHEALAFIRERTEQAAFFKAFLEKYGWPTDEGPPNYNTKIILFPADRARSKARDTGYADTGYGIRRHGIRDTQTRDTGYADTGYGIRRHGKNNVFLF